MNADWIRQVEAAVESRKRRKRRFCFFLSTLCFCFATLILHGESWSGGLLALGINIQFIGEL